jgi:glycosyltransferase involved in cell wall biosynthesis
MNILQMISSPASGGAEVYVKDLAISLSKEGHKLHVAFLSSASDIDRDVEYEKEFIKDLQNFGVTTYIIGNETRKKPWLGISRLRSYVLNNNIEICHTHLAYGIIFSLLLTKPVVYTHHSIKPRWNKITYNFFNLIVDRYIGISEICAEALQNYSGKKVVRIRNAVSINKFSKYRRERVLGGKVVVAMVGRISAQKDYMNMLRAINLLDCNIRNRLKIIIAGEGDITYKEELLYYIKINNLSDLVEFVGIKNNIPKFLYEADIFLMSSSYEGLPIALIEASISGLPCIVTDVGGCSEIIKNSNNGVCVPPHSPQSLAYELTRFLLEDEVLEVFSKNAINNSHIYSIDNAKNLHMNLYTSLIK